ncbi:MAG: LEA type 2 family protein [Gammaproteobacteria bacterium]|nr:LEA type 2 family protein [Gammaproteobacteria bacterium]
MLFSRPMTHRPALIALALFISVTLYACSSLPLTKPEAPIVSVADVRPLNLSFTEQRLAFTLRVENPNAYDLPLEGLDFIASFAGHEIATGESHQEVTIPAKGEAMLEVEVKAGVDKLISQFQSMLNAQEINLDYGVKGRVKLANWPSRIPFDVKGEIAPPQQP